MKIVKVKDLRIGDLFYFLDGNRFQDYYDQPGTELDGAMFVVCNKTYCPEGYYKITSWTKLPHRDKFTDLGIFRAEADEPVTLEGNIYSDEALHNYYGLEDISGAGETEDNT